MFHIFPAVDNGLLHFRLTGLWSEDEAHRFETAIEMEIARLSAAGPDFVVLADLVDYPPQFQTVASIHQRIMGKLREGGMRKAATVVAALMTKIQVNRLNPSGNHEFFTSKDAARAWLRA